MFRFPAFGLVCVLGATAPASAQGDVPLARDAFVDYAVRTSPHLAPAEAEARASEARARVERALDAPVFDAQMWNTPISRPWALGQAEMYMFAVSQALPAPGVRTARARAAEHEARAARSERSSHERDVRARASALHAEWVAVHAELGLAAETIELVRRLRELALARYGARAAGLADVARLDAELAELERRRLSLEAEREVVLGAIDALLGRPVDAPLPPPPDEEPTTVVIPEDVRNGSVASRSELEATRARIDASSDRARAYDLAARRPAFGVSVSYWQPPHGSVGYGASVAMTLPWLSRRGRAEADEARAEQARLEAELRSLERDATMEVVEATRRLAAIDTSLRALDEATLPALERAITAAEAGYATAAVDLPTWLETHRTRLSAVDESIRLRRDHEIAIAALERALGRTLPRTPMGDAR